MAGKFTVNCKHYVDLKFRLNTITPEVLLIYNVIDFKYFLLMRFCTSIISLYESK